MTDHQWSINPDPTHFLVNQKNDPKNLSILSNCVSIKIQVSERQQQNYCNTISSHKIIPLEAVIYFQKLSIKHKKSRNEKKQKISKQTEKILIQDMKMDHISQKRAPIPIQVRLIGTFGYQFRSLWGQVWINEV